MKQKYKIGTEVYCLCYGDVKETHVLPGVILSFHQLDISPVGYYKVKLRNVPREPACRYYVEKEIHTSYKPAQRTLRKYFLELARIHKARLKELTTLINKIEKTL